MKAKLAAAGVLGVLLLAWYLGPLLFGLLVLGLVALVAVFHAAKWAFWPRAELPQNRVRHQRIRLYLRLHPGRGHATLFELHRHWGRQASYKRSSQVRAS